MGKLGLLFSRVPRVQSVLWAKHGLLPLPTRSHCTSLSAHLQRLHRRCKKNPNLSGVKLVKNSQLGRCPKGIVIGVLKYCGYLAVSTLSSKEFHK